MNGEVFFCQKINPRGWSIGFPETPTDMQPEILSIPMPKML
jgi:hypothetical protein